MEALTSGDVDECVFEFRTELCQMLGNIYIELRRSLMSLMGHGGMVGGPYLSSAGGVLRI